MPIIGDISEHKRVHDAFFKRLGKTYSIAEIGTWDCKNKKILLQRGEKTFCATVEETPILLDYGFEYKGNKVRCATCGLRSYVRFADFEIAPKRAYYERKTSSDFVASRRTRLYEQLEKMDTFIEGRKGLILEGMPRHIKFQDSKNFFSGYDKKVHDLRGMSPLEIGSGIVVRL